MFAAIQTANANGHFIYMLNWWSDLTVSLVFGNPNLGALLSSAVAAGVQVRAMLWDQANLPRFSLLPQFWPDPSAFQQNTAQVTQINAITPHPSIKDANGGAILDNNTLAVGSHHQKILVVNGSSGLIGFCGGVDFNPDRIHHLDRQPGSPMHDVHCRIQGTAAWDLLNIFLQRWSDHPSSAAIDSAKGALRGDTVGLPLPPDPGTQYVQIGRTFGNGSGHISGSGVVGIKSKSGNGWYSWAPNGEQTAQGIIFHAIEQAKKFIYIQDQYLISMDASNKLKAQLPNIDRLIILIPHPNLSDLPNVWCRQKAFLDNLGYDASAVLTDKKYKILVRYLKPLGAAPGPPDSGSVLTYVHSKIWIMDDRFAVIGSANCNNRGYNHDSEVVAGIYDESQDTPCTMHFAHALRIRLWAWHLSMSPAALFDPGADSHWMYPFVSSRIATFDQNAGQDPLVGMAPTPNTGIGPLTDPFGG
jgi:phosphatidylserine/phosphatidylglycerophosphate/cardiolipin synthase-like enzyme